MARPLWLHFAGGVYHVTARLLVDLEQIIPLPEATEYQVRLREKQERERAARKNKWDLDRVLRELQDGSGASAAAVARELYEWAEPLCSYVWFGEGERVGSFTPILVHHGTKYHLFVVKTRGWVQIRFMNLRGKGPFRGRPQLDELRRRLNEITGVDLSEEDVDGKPNFPLAALQSPGALQQFKETVRWLIDTIRST